MHYSWEEKNDMYDLYIKNNRNAAAALREYGRKYPQRRRPSKFIFRRTETMFKATKNFTNTKRRREKHVLNQEVELNILLYFQEHPQASIRNCSRILNVSVGSIHSILKKHKYRPYSKLPVQKLLLPDFNSRLLFCENIISRYRHYDPNIFSKILWTDESSFSTSGCFNRRNTHHWSSENPHCYKEIQHQGRQSIQVWCGILNNKIIGPIFFNGTLNGARYLMFLQENIAQFLDDIPLRQLGNIIWQQDGAPCHNTNQVQQHLNNNYREWIGRHGTILWPPRSPDLTPLDTFLWGYLKNKVYQENYLTIEIIQEKIQEEINFLNNNIYILNNVKNNIVKRYNLCIAQNGGHIEHLL